MALKFVWVRHSVRLTIAITWPQEAIEGCKAHLAADQVNGVVSERSITHQIFGYLPELRRHTTIALSDSREYIVWKVGFGDAAST